MDSIDYELLASALMRALRGDRSQTAFSRRLGYRGNVSYTWESGRSWPTAAVFLYAAQRVHIDVEAGVSAFYRTPPTWLDGTDLTTAAGVAMMLDDLRGQTSVVELAEATGRSRYAVGRWLKGQTEPRLPDFLRLVEASSLRLLDFLAIFENPARLPPVRRAWERLEAARSVFYHHPWTQLVLLALELEPARTATEQPGWIAERISMPLADVTRALALLEDTGQITRSGRRWRVGRVQAIDTRRHPDAGTVLKSYWSGVAMERMAAGEEGLFSYNVFTASDADALRIEQIYRDAYRAMRNIVGHSTPSERVVLVNVQVVGLDR
jgi:transcriptional regulator with XRE-family HTH domain